MSLPIWFVEHRGAATASNMRCSSSSSFVEHLAARGMAKPPVPPTPAKIARTALRREYEDYLHRQRGLSDKTIASCWHRSEIADLQCLDDAQGNGSLRPHEADGASERVSRSDEFGYVFRYDVVTTENDDR